MSRLTPLGKLTIVVLILGALYGGFRVLQNQGILGKRNQTARTNTSPADASGEGAGTAGESGTAGGSGDASSAPASAGSEATPVNNAGRAFSYTPPAPENGKLKGVVELGASGFNSFIIRVDPRKTGSSKSQSSATASCWKTWPATTTCWPASSGTSAACSTTA
jgi:hypothetical protein